MNDLISRQAAITEFSCCELTPDGGIDANYAIDFLKQLPSAQSEIEERKEESVRNVPKEDLISRKAAIEVIDAVFPVDPMKSEYAQGIACGAALAKTYVEHLPSAKSEIIHCKDCKHYKAYEYTGRLACHYVIGGTVARKSDDFCSRAERITDE